ncbi:uncharacterized protein LOC128553573 [Mercenaria mercenaria]|uniref:uncharacterized protein LOC128553573 n=1 Tax=Mercenaria mercenaria TaxID=6596 RepID=UPI00234E641B|nr:uncharacterized protein LOC128553573 [Mercenaria mercenaria]
MHMLYILVFLTALSIRRVGSIECHNCSSINDVNDCVSTSPCRYGQSCYLTSKHNGDTPLYTLGCMDHQVCGQQSHVSGALVGRDLTERQTSDCHECCSTDNCNKYLCQHLKPAACIDDVKVDCALMNTIFNICQDIHHAKTVCSKFCGLCSLVDGN